MYWELMDKSSNTSGGESRVAYCMEANGIIKGADYILGTTYESLLESAQRQRYLD